MLLRDIRYALRALSHSRGFVLTAILCLGFGIGLTTTIFSIVDGVLLKPFPYADPERIVVVQMQNQQRGITESNLSWLDYRDLKESTRAFASLGASQGRSLTIADAGREPERYVGAAITWDLFRLLGISPMLGQGFTAEQDAPGQGGVVILSHALWRDRYASDPSVIGRQTLINAVPSVIVGVMPEFFEFPSNQKLWIPIQPIVSRDARNIRGLFTFGRLAPDVTLEQASTEMDAISARLASQHPETNQHFTGLVKPLRAEFIPPDVSRVIWLMMAAATLVLFIACSNVANLQLARASARRREISVRTALGAQRGRIIRQLLTESVVLSLLSLPIGVVLAEVGTRLISSAVPRDQVPYYIRWEVDWRALAFTVAVAVTTAVLFGLFPALQASRGDLHGDLKEGTRGNSVRRSLLRSSLVVVQVALALVSLIGALLFVRTFANLDSYDVGFDTKPLMTMRFYLPGAQYEVENAKARRVQDIVERVERLAGVQSAFASNLVPVSGGGGGGNVIIDGRPSEPGREPGISFVGVTPGFYRTLGVTIVRGRDFTASEGWSRTPVSVINATMARQMWPDRDPIGGRFRLTAGDESEEWFTVIGVAPDIKQDDIDPDDELVPTAYVPYSYQQTLNTGLTVRVAGDPAAITGAVRGELRASDPNLPMFQVRTMEDVRRLGFWQFSLFGWIFGTTGVIGLLLAAIGVYGVLAYAVAQRTPEIGVRVALGADRGHVLRLILSHGMLLAGLGVVVGLVLSALAMPAASTLLYEVSPYDPVTFAAVSIFLLTVALVASYLPARRAMRVDPLVALRGE